jgi:hypothetical protein
MFLMLVVTGLLVAISLSAAYWRSRRAHPAAFTLASIPCIMLLFTMPVPAMILSTIRGFHTASQRQSDSVPRVADLLIGLERPLWWGSVLAGAIVVGCAVLQLLRSRDAPESIANAVDETAVVMSWRDWSLSALPLFVLPVALLVLIVEGIPSLVIGRILEATSSTQSATAGAGELRVLSQLIASRLLASMFASIVVIALNLVTVAVAIFLAGSVRASERLATYSWIVIVVVLTGTAVNAFKVDSDIRWIKARSQAIVKR